MRCAHPNSLDECFHLGSLARPSRTIRPVFIPYPQSATPNATNTSCSVRSNRHALSADSRQNLQQLGGAATAARPRPIWTDAPNLTVLPCATAAGAEMEYASALPKCVIQFHDHFSAPEFGSQALSSILASRVHAPERQVNFSANCLASASAVASAI